MNLRVPFRIALALSVAVASACDYSRHELAARRAAGDFHERYDQSQFGAIYAQTDFGFRHGETALRFIRRMKGQRDSLGAVVKAELADQSARGDQQSGALVEQEYHTRFERGVAVERLTWRVKSASLEPRLLSYHVR